MGIAPEGLQGFGGGAALGLVRKGPKLGLQGSRGDVSHSLGASTTDKGGKRIVLVRGPQGRTGKTPQEVEVCLPPSTPQHAWWPWRYHHSVEKVEVSLSCQLAVTPL